ncbi:hypothetical protein [uncultured Psychrobacter sp.]|uniref:hypothetical protein n=1 Tax=uncultured Psychrobacter sp. TaxID=259303 RepID=UPI00345905C4
MAGYASRAVVSKKLFNWGDNDVLGTVLNKVFSDTDPQDLIFKHIDTHNYRSYLQASQEIIELKKQIISARHAFVKAITSDGFKFVLKNDFDIEDTHDEETAKSYEAMIARCVAGIGADDSNLGVPQSILDAFDKTAPKSNDAADEEFKQSLLPQLSRGIGMNENWLLKALGGLDKEFIEILYDFQKKDRASEATGSGIGYISEKISATGLNRITIKNERSALANKNALINTMTQNLLKLSFFDPKAFRNLHVTLEASIYGHHGLVVVPKRVTASMDTMAAFANYTMGIAVPKTVQDTINARARKLKARVKSAYEISSGSTVIRSPNIDTPAQARSYVLHYLEEAARTGTGVSALESLNNGQSINLDALNAEQLAAEAKEWHGKKMNAGAGVVSAFIAFLQLKSVITSFPMLSKLHYAGDKLLLTEIQLGTVSTSLALVTASMDTTAAGASVFGRASFASKLVYGAGWIGVVGAVLEVGSLAIYGYRKFNDGNKLSFGMTFGAGVSISASAAAGWIYGYGLVSSATGGLAAIPGSVLLGIMLIGLSLSYTFQRLAYKYDDKQNVLIEYWLDNSVFGHKAMRTQDYSLINPFQSKPAFSSLAEDISGFITACSGFFARSVLSKNQGRSNGILGGAAAQLHGIKFNSQVVMGQFIDSSELHISVELVTKDGKVLSNIFNMSMSSTNRSPQSTGNGDHFDRSQVIVENKDKNTVVTIKDIYIKDGVYSADNIKKGRVIIKYIADTTQNPVYPLYDFAYMDNNKY